MKTYFEEPDKEAIPRAFHEQRLQQKDPPESCWKCELTFRCVFASKPLVGNPGIRATPWHKNLISQLENWIWTTMQAKDTERHGLLYFLYFKNRVHEENIFCRAQLAGSLIQIRYVVRVSLSPLHKSFSYYINLELLTKLIWFLEIWGEMEYLIKIKKFKCGFKSDIVCLTLGCHSNGSEEFFETKISQNPTK